MAKLLKSDEFVIQIAIDAVGDIFGLTNEGNLVYWHNAKKDWVYQSDTPRETKL